MGIGITMHFSKASSGQSLQAPEGFGWQLQSCIVAFWKHKPDHRHRTTQLLNPSCSRRATRDGWENTSSYTQGWCSQTSCHKYFHFKILTLVFLHLSESASPKCIEKKKSFWQRKHKKVRFRVLQFKITLHIRIDLLSLGKRNPFYR